MDDTTGQALSRPSAAAFFLRFFGDMDLLARRFESAIVAFRASFQEIRMSLTEEEMNEMIRMALERAMDQINGGEDIKLRDALLLCLERTRSPAEAKRLLRDGYAPQTEGAAKEMLSSAKRNANDLTKWLSKQVPRIAGDALAMVYRPPLRRPVHGNPRVSLRGQRYSDPQFVCTSCAHSADQRPV